MTLFYENFSEFMEGLETSADDRFYPNSFPQGVVPESLPAVKYFLVSDPQVYSHSGRSGFQEPRWQLDCWAETYYAARSLANDIKIKVAGYVGKMGTQDVQPIFYENLRDNFDPETGKHWVNMDLVIQHVDKEA